MANIVHSDGDYTEQQFATLTNIAVGVSAVQTVLVVEVDGISERLLGTVCPLQDLLCPVHAQEAVHLAFNHQLLLHNHKHSTVYLQSAFHTDLSSIIH